MSPLLNEAITAPIVHAAGSVVYYNLLYGARRNGVTLALPANKGTRLKGAIIKEPWHPWLRRGIFQTNVQNVERRSCAQVVR